MSGLLATSVSIGAVLLKALGLEGQLIKRVVIDIDALDIVNVTVYRYVTDETLRAAIGELEVDKYKLVRREEAPE